MQGSDGVRSTVDTEEHSGQDEEHSGHGGQGSDGMRTVFVGAFPPSRNSFQTIESK